MMTFFAERKKAIHPMWPHVKKVTVGLTVNMDDHDTWVE